MASILSVVIGFVLTGLIGNRLVQAWQSRNWFLQQRFAGKEKEYLALKELADEIAVLLGIRMYHMQRLAGSLLKISDEKLATRVAEYEEAVKRWNERLTSFYVRLPLLASYEMAHRLESSLQVEFVNLSTSIDKLLHDRQAGGAPSKREIEAVGSKLSNLQGRVINFNKEMLRTVEGRRSEVYYGEKVPFTSGNLAAFSTWQLIKALFIRDINSFSITRSALDP